MLDRIITDKRGEVEQRKQRFPLAGLREAIARGQTPLDFAGALRGDGTRLIAEVKRASPSRGLLCPEFDPVKLAKTYAANGAAAISVLTEEKYFQGSLDHLAAIRKEVALPLLRKDFIFDPYQVYESRAYGADGLLLIVAVLEQEQLGELLSLGRKLGMGCLVEVHNEKEVAGALAAGAEIIGINNRDLKTFKVDIKTTRRLRPLIPEEYTVISESGIRSGEDVAELKKWGINAILAGETLVTADDIPSKVREITA